MDKIEERTEIVDEPRKGPGHVNIDPHLLDRDKFITEKQKSKQTSKENDNKTPKKVND